MANWAGLLKELLQRIAERFESPFDYLHFRSVCCSWRDAAPHSPTRFSSRSQIHIINEMEPDSGAFYLYRRSIIQVGAPESHCSESSSDWLTKIEETRPQNLRILQPLAGYRLAPVPPQLSHFLDFTNIRVVEVYEEYILEDVLDNPPSNPLGDFNHFYMERVTFASDPSGEFIVLTVHYSGNLAMFKSDKKEWFVIQESPMIQDNFDFFSRYDDVIFFDDKFYAVDGTGWLVIVNTDPHPFVTLASATVLRGDIKYLMKCGGDLLLLNIFKGLGMTDDSDDDSYGYHNLDESVFPMNERKVRFEVYKLNPEAHKWVRVLNLKDWILFLGNNCAFSVPVSDFSGYKGNIIYFTDHCLDQIMEDYSFFNWRGIGVYDLDDDRIYNLAKHDGYSKLLWPPPTWFTSIRFRKGQHNYSSYLSMKIREVSLLELEFLGICNRHNALDAMLKSF